MNKFFLTPIRSEFEMKETLKKWTFKEEHWQNHEDMESVIIQGIKAPITHLEPKRYVDLGDRFIERGGAHG